MIYTWMKAICMYVSYNTSYLIFKQVCYQLGLCITFQCDGPMGFCFIIPTLSKLEWSIILISFQYCYVVKENVNNVLLS